MKRAVEEGELLAGIAAVELMLLTGGLRKLRSDWSVSPAQLI